MIGAPSQGGSRPRLSRSGPNGTLPITPFSNPIGVYGSGIVAGVQPAGSGGGGGEYRAGAINEVPVGRRTPRPRPPLRPPAHLGSGEEGGVDLIVCRVSDACTRVRPLRCQRLQKPTPTTVTLALEREAVLYTYQRPPRSAPAFHETRDQLKHSFSIFCPPASTRRDLPTARQPREVPTPPRNHRNVDLIRGTLSTHPTATPRHKHPSPPDTHLPTPEWAKDASPHSTKAR